MQRLPKHEVFGFRNGDTPLLNNLKLGASGRYRTNVWDYPGINSFSGRDDLEMHPTSAAPAPEPHRQDRPAAACICFASSCRRQAHPAATKCF